MIDPIVYAINHNGLNHDGRPIPAQPDENAEICPKCSQPIPAEYLADHLLIGHVETVDTTTMDPIVYALRFNAAREASKTLGDPGTPGRRY